ncbi:multiple epidermal growth factor-like domains protein 10 isoform X2 [Scylla paramamosain]|uniref:multiple epidermal growth factor-like domains protein 10 isoform X2 n=1 Tax=Scylla paramamosain TaxID=85552 RepID=UPI0030828B4B
MKAACVSAWLYGARLLGGVCSGEVGNQLPAQVSLCQQGRMPPCRRACASRTLIRDSQDLTVTSAARHVTTDQAACMCGSMWPCDPITGECLCPTGTHGPSCLQLCAPGRWGEGCLQECQCENGASCDCVSGKCHCLPGYVGPVCKTKCPSGRFGVGCCDTSSCLNGATCHHITGRCECMPGFTGPCCSQPCPLGCFGQDCVHTCDCNSSRCN